MEKKKRILEVGHGLLPLCRGLNFLLREFPENLEYHGIDKQSWEAINKEYSENRREFNLKGAYLYRMAGEKLGFPDCIFDEVHFHFVATNPSISREEVHDIIAEARRVLKDKGKVIASGEMKEPSGVKRGMIMVEHALCESNFLINHYTYGLRFGKSDAVKFKAALEGTLFPQILEGITVRSPSMGGLFLTIGQKN